MSGLDRKGSSFWKDRRLLRGENMGDSKEREQKKNKNSWDREKEIELPDVPVVKKEKNLCGR